MNLTLLRGTVARPPSTRSLPSGTVVIEWSLTVPDPAGSDRFVSVPVTWADPPGAPPEVGDELVVLGGVRRRFFRVGGVTQSRTEVVVSSVAPAGRRRSVRTLHTRARRLLDDMAG